MFKCFSAGDAALREELDFLRSQLAAETTARMKLQRQLKQEQARNKHLEQEVANAAAAAQELGENILAYFASGSAPPSPAAEPSRQQEQPLSSSNDSDPVRDHSAALHRQQHHHPSQQGGHWATPKKAQRPAPSTAHSPAGGEQWYSPGRGGTAAGGKGGRSAQMQAVRISQQLTSMAATLRGRLDAVQGAGDQD